MLELVTMKSEDGLYVAKDEFNYNGRGSIKSDQLSLNGVSDYEDTHHKSWVFFRGIENITKVEKQPFGYDYYNPRWVREVIDLPVAEEFPLEFSCEDACEYLDDDDSSYYIGVESKYYNIRKFYVREVDKVRKQKFEIDFTVKNLGDVSVDSKNNYSDMKIVRHKEGSFSSGDSPTIDLSSITLYSELEEILVPDLEIHNRPCSLSQENTYKVIRSYVKNNIDERYARVVSDYDFCFKVDKRLSIKPYIEETEQKKDNGKSYSKPRITKREIKYSKFTIFEMCSSKPYQSYTPIEAFRGDNLRDLADNIKRYLDELMNIINQPLKECNCCNGTGVEEVGKFDSNKRDY